MRVVIYRATQRSFQPKLGKIKKNPPRKKFLIFQEMELLGSNIKKFQETETPKKILYISGNGNPEKSFLSFGKWNFSVRPEKISYISGNKNPEKISYIFLKESFSYISGNETPKKFFMFQETELS